MGHVESLIASLKRKEGRPVTAMTDPPRTYDLPGLRDFSGPSRQQVIMYKREFNLCLKSKGEVEAELAKKGLKKEKRKDLKVQLVYLKGRLEYWETKLGPLVPLEREYGFPEVNGDAK